MTTAHDDDDVGGRRNTGSRGPWDPFKSFRKTISPEERMALLQVKVPIQPPEDFMDTMELRRLKLTRLQDKLRRVGPALIGLGALLAAILAAAIWPPSWLSATPVPANTTEVHAETPPSNEPSAAVTSSNLPGIAEPLAPVPQRVPSARALVPTPAPQTQAPLQVTSARASLKAVPLTTTGTSASPAVRAPKAQKHPPDELDLDTPLAPPVH